MLAILLSVCGMIAVTDDKQLLSLVEEYAKTFAALPLEVQENYLASLRLSFVHNTVAIEGNQASPLDAELLLKYKVIPQKIGYQDLFDLVGQDLALARMREYAELKTPVDQDVICELHRIALYPTPFAGRYRNTSVVVHGGVGQVSAVAHISRDMRFFVEDLRHLQFSNPIEKAAFTHCQFVKIHPFADGNGRTARLIMNLSLLNDDFPLVDINVKNREAYMQAVESYVCANDLKPFQEFLAQTLSLQIKDFLAQCSEGTLPDKEAHYKGVFFVSIRANANKSALCRVLDRIEGAQYSEKYNVWVIPNSERELVENIAGVEIYDSIADVPHGA